MALNGIDWIVESNKGRYGEKWRWRFAGTEEAARIKYGTLVRNLRRGGVRLLNPEGGTEAILINDPRFGQHRH